MVLCAFSSFLFGWHVHEKAILLVILPLTILAIYTDVEANIFLLVSITGCYSLLPLLHEPAETPTKLLIFSLYFFYTYKGLHVLWFGEAEVTTTAALKQIDDNVHGSLMRTYERYYLIGLIAIQAFTSFGSQLSGLESRMPFLPLLLTSLYCSLGVFYSWLKLYWFTLTECNYY